MTYRRFSRSKSHGRRGVIMLMLLVVFGISLAMCGAWTRAILRNRQVQRLAEEQIQAAWLADAGVRRAAASLAVDAIYKGETWRVASSDLSRPGAATVVIRVEPVADAPGRSRITARASYPRGAVRVRETKTVVFNSQAEPQS
jgi:hypothetical protein